MLRLSLNELSMFEDSILRYSITMKQYEPPFLALVLEYFFSAHFPQSFSSKFQGGNFFFFGFCVDGFPFYSFSANAIGQQPSFYACSVCTVRYIAVFFSPPTPNGVSAKHNSMFSASEQIAFRRTQLFNRQHGHTHLRWIKFFFDADVLASIMALTEFYKPFWFW
jgi:hypothetical protein